MRFAILSIFAAIIISSSARGDFIQYFKFDGDATATVGTNGTAANGASFTPSGKLGGALDLDNASGDNNQHVTAGNINLLGGSTNFTFSAWFNQRANSADATASNHVVDNALFGQSSASGNDNIEFGVSNLSGGSATSLQLYLDSLNGDATVTESPGGITGNTWHHVAWAFDGTTDTAQIFLDGQLVATRNDWGGTVDPAGTTSPFSVGIARPGSNDWADFDGLIDDLAFFDSTLSEGESIAVFRLGDEAAFQYDAAIVDDLLELHDLGAGGGQLAQGDWLWQFADSPSLLALAPNAGDLASTGGNGFFLNISGTSGLFATIPLTPEPGTFLLAGVSLVLGAGFYFRRRNRQ